MYKSFFRGIGYFGRDSLIPMLLSFGVYVIVYYANGGAKNDKLYISIISVVFLLLLAYSFFSNYKARNLSYGEIFGYWFYIIVVLIVSIIMALSTESFLVFLSPIFASVIGACISSLITIKKNK